MAYSRKLADGQQCRVSTYDIVERTATVVHTSTAVLFEAPNWTRDGQLVLNGDGLLWTMAADGSAPPRAVPFTGLPDLNNDHVLAPDSASIYLSADDGHIYRGRLSGGPARRITGDDRMHFLHGVSPDGSTLAYVGIVNQQWDSGTLWTIGSDGGKSTPLTTGDGPDDGPEYAPDGGWIYFNTERFSGHAQIARVRPNGGGMEQLTYDERVNWFPHLSPAGDHAVYLSYPPGTEGHPADLRVELRLVVDGDWKAAQTLVELPGGQGTINVNSWSPDGRHFAYVDYPA
ncbi:TolB family protein [Actinoplanes derwentensis]|uniref:WD40-like Beta Propeller Repeat n=1 Tax=Actinoplanes derwentensis TaxID=113562 RepID=A0A1H1VJF1_9ACTN|nr:PD40 domain-containing protein [Actinoplanes derwentensis]GID83684.1 hypothetical protein Ade03nite_26080 [Actinoplanes derwentensis]SDS84650.1 WD40-like Beta Propeller Repeat [Actinoplanes derwentensis]